MVVGNFNDALLISIEVVASTATTVIVSEIPVSQGCYGFRTDRKFTNLVVYATCDRLSNDTNVFISRVTVALQGVSRSEWRWEKKIMNLRSMC